MNEIFNEKNSLELFHEKDTFNFDCELEINEIFVVKNEIFDSIDEFEIEKFESFHKDFLNEQILVEIIEVVDDIEKDEIEISSVKDKVKNDSNKFDDEDILNESLVDNDKIKCFKEKDEIVYEKFIDEIIY
jgi:hypothetical protein